MKNRLFVVLVLAGLCLSLFAAVGAAGAKAEPKATGDIWMSGPSQQISFAAFASKGTVEYWNYDYPGALHYTTSVLYTKFDGPNAWFVFQIPAGWPSLTGLYVIAYVHDGGTPGTGGDQYGHTATGSYTAALAIADNEGVGAMYPVTAGNLVVH